MEGRDLPPEKELLEHVPLDIFETAQHIASRGPFLIAQQALPAMRRLSPGTLMSLLLGRYHRPVAEDRIFMFLDVNDSRLSSPLGSTSADPSHGPGSRERMARTAEVSGTCLASPFFDRGWRARPP